MAMEEKKKSKVSAVVLAAGRGRRMNSDIPKQFLPLSGKPVLYYSLKAFEDSRVENLVIVTSREEIPYVEKEIVQKYDFRKVCAVVEGGRERYFSVLNGLKALYAAQDVEVLQDSYVLIHDGARPFVSGEIIERCIEGAARYGACVAGMPVKDTIKLASEDGFAVNTPKRSLVWMVQTPQAFSFPLIYDAYCQLEEKEETLAKQGVSVTDDASVVELFTEKKVKLVEGSYENIKITTPEDLKIAETFLNSV